MSYATTGDVEVELGRPANSTNETAQWQAWLDRVERSIRRRFVAEGFDLDVQVGLDSPTAQDVADVEITRVIDKINNPAGYTSTTRSVDDASITVRREGFDSLEALTITDDEWAALLPGGRRKRVRAFSVLPS